MPPMSLTQIAEAVQGRLHQVSDPDLPGQIEIPGDPS